MLIGRCVVRSAIKHVGTLHNCAYERVVCSCVEEVGGSEIPTLHRSEKMCVPRALLMIRSAVCRVG